MVSPKTTLVLGLGNPFLSDDTAGIHAALQASEKFAAHFPQVDFQTDLSGNFDLVELLPQYRQVLIIDSICTGQAEPGHCHEYDWDAFRELQHRVPVNFHSFNLPTVLEISRRCGYSLPDDIHFIGIEGQEFTRFSEWPTWPLEPVLADVLKRVARVLEIWTQPAMPTPRDGECAHA